MGSEQKTADVGTGCAANADRHLWPLVSEVADADSIHVTANGGIGINVGGRIIVMPLRQWFSAGLACQSDPDRLRSLGTAEVQEGWRCAECGCRGFARVDTHQPDGTFRPGPDIRCVNCKAVSASPAPPRAVDGLREALDLCLVGGNHIASVLIGRLGGGFAGSLSPDASHEYARARIDDQDTYEIWCCWSALMRARDMVDAALASSPAPLPNPEVEGRAWAVIETLRAGEWCSHPCGVRAGCGCADAIQSALDAAVAAEREACARVAEQPVILDAMRGITDVRPFGREIAAAIRSRSQNPEGGADNG